MRMYVRNLSDTSAFAAKIRQAGAAKLSAELDVLGADMVAEAPVQAARLGVNLNRSDSGERHGVRLADSFDFEVDAGSDFPVSVALTSSAPQAAILNAPARSSGYPIVAKNAPKLFLPPTRSRHPRGWSGRAVIWQGGSKGAGFVRSAAEQATRRFLARFR